MIRLAGVLLGATLAVAALLAVFGVPRFEHPAISVDSDVITLPLKPPAPAETATEPAAPQPSAAAAEAVADVAAIEEPDPSPVGPVEPVGPPAAAGADDVSTVAADSTELPALETDAQLVQWYAFWSPFRSEVAANGFVSQLQRVTGLDYRIVKVKPGVYEVAFAYGDAEELTASLTQIASATGLDMPDE